jgi:hypothetical protein
VRLRLIFDDPRHPDFDLLLWVPDDEPRRDGWTAGEAVHEANSWIARVEALLRRPTAKRAAAAEVAARTPLPVAQAMEDDEEEAFEDEEDLEEDEELEDDEESEEDEEESEDEEGDDDAPWDEDEEESEDDEDEEDDEDGDEEDEEADDEDDEDEEVEEEEEDEDAIP